MSESSASSASSAVTDPPLTAPSEPQRKKARADAQEDAETLVGKAAALRTMFDTIQREVADEQSAMQAQEAARLARCARARAPLPGITEHADAAWVREGADDPWGWPWEWPPRAAARAVTQDEVRKVADSRGIVASRVEVHGDYILLVANAREALADARSELERDARSARLAAARDQEREQAPTNEGTSQ